MADPRHVEPSTRETTTQARAGSTPGIGRNVLFWSTLLVVIIFYGDRLGWTTLST